MKEFIEKSQVKAITDKEYDLEQLPEAHTYMENGQKKGALIINI